MVSRPGRYRAVAIALIAIGGCLLNAIQIVMTGVMTGIVYFLLVAFAGFQHKDSIFQVVSLADIVMASFLVMRKLFP